MKSYFEEKYNLVVPKINFPLMNRELELWALTGFSEGVQVKEKKNFYKFKFLANFPKFDQPILRLAEQHWRSTDHNLGIVGT